MAVFRELDSALRHREAAAFAPRCRISARGWPVGHPLTSPHRVREGSWTCCARSGTPGGWPSPPRPDRRANSRPRPGSSAARFRCGAWTPAPATAARSRSPRPLQPGPRRRAVRCPPGGLAPARGRGSGDRPGHAERDRAAAPHGRRDARAAARGRGRGTARSTAGSSRAVTASRVPSPMSYQWIFKFPGARRSRARSWRRCGKRPGGECDSGRPRDDQRTGRRGERRASPYARVQGDGHVGAVAIHDGGIPHCAIDGAHDRGPGAGRQGS